MAENIKTTVEELRKLINVDNVIGTPIERCWSRTNIHGNDS